MADLLYLVAGLALLLAVILPRLLQHVWLSPPLVLVLVGLGLGATPIADRVRFDPVTNGPIVEHVTELTVLIALMGVGLAIDRPIDLRSLASIRRWSPAWRLLAVTMPLCIAGVALLGWAAGIAPAAALLLGAVLAPTDPVLASDVQVGAPTDLDAVESIEEIDEHDEVRFALSSEAGLNDGLAFPFVYAAILLATTSALGWGDLAHWVSWFLLGKIAVGVLAGLVVGWGLGKVAFGAHSEPLRLAEHGESLLALAALLTAYGASEVCGGYGFLSVFTCALSVRATERHHEYHRAMHEVVERLERLLTLLVLLVLGVAMSRGLLAHLDWRAAGLALALVFVVRPVAGIAALAGTRSPSGGRLTGRERLAIAFFGVRGVGSIYYLAYAVGHADFAEARWLWSAVAFTIVLSVIVHGVLATPVMRHLEGRRAARGRRALD